MPGLQPRCAARRRAYRGRQGQRAAPRWPRCDALAREVGPAPSPHARIRSGPDTWPRCWGPLLGLKQSRALFSVKEALGAFRVAEPVAPEARGDPRKLRARGICDSRPWTTTTTCSEAACLHFQSHSRLVSSLSQAQWGLLSPPHRRSGPVGPLLVPFLPEAGVPFNRVSCANGPWG